ncbi:MAG: GHMP kinase [Desulfobacterota bacterium]|nr:GHMP kinase [Thermodesulfobacteriota bacterium]
MIITRTPFRISFVGGGSDIEEFYSRWPGAVLSTTINKYMYISTHRFWDEEIIVAKYSRTEMVKDINELHHPIIREVLRKFNVTGALEISSNADVGAGTGLGSSSSFTVGLLHNLYSVFGKFVTKQQLAEEACDIEINRLREPIGKQDQYAAAFGGLNIFRFDCSGGVTVEPLHLKKEIYKALQNRLMMFYLGTQRSASAILAEQKKNMQLKQSNFEWIREMVGLVDELRDVLYQGRLEEFGKILHKNWEYKQRLSSKITSNAINDLYDMALRNGATGGKVLGAGGGGFLLLYCEPERQERLRSALGQLRHMKFKFENEGSKIIYIGDEYLEH